MIGHIHHMPDKINALIVLDSDYVIREDSHTKYFVMSRTNNIRGFGFLVNLSPFLTKHERMPHPQAKLFVLELKVGTCYLPPFS